MSGYGYGAYGYGYGGYGYGGYGYGSIYRDSSHPYQIAKGYAIGGYPINSVEYGGYSVHSYIQNGSSYSITSIYQNEYGGRVGYYSDYNYDTGRGDIQQNYLSPTGDSYATYQVFTSAGYSYFHSYEFNLEPKGSDSFSSSRSYTSYYGPSGANSQYELDRNTLELPNGGGYYEFRTYDTSSFRSEDAYGYTTYTTGSSST